MPDWLDIVIRIAPFVLLPLLFVMLTVRPSVLSKRLIRRHIEQDKGGHVSAIYGLGDGAYEVVYFDRDEVKRKGKCMASHATGVLWAEDTLFDA